MTALAVCLLLHWLLARFVPWPWWVPNLTLAGLLLAVVKRPSQWLLFGWAAGWFASLWTVRASSAVFASYIAAAWLIQLMARRWNLEDRRAQAWLAGAGTLVFTLALVWMESIPVLPVLALIGGHAAATCAVLPLLRRVASVT